VCEIALIYKKISKFNTKNIGQGSLKALSVFVSVCGGCAYGYDEQPVEIHGHSCFHILPFFPNSSFKNSLIHRYY